MRSNNWLGGALLAVCALLAIAAPALAQKSADTLRITWREAIPDVDPYYNSQRTGMVVAFQAFGLRKDSGWFRLSAGAVSPKEIEEGLRRVRETLQSL